MRLVLRGRVHAVHAALEVPARERAQGVADVHRDGGVLRLDPLPLVLRVQDLQGRDGLAEEQREGPEVGVARHVHAAHLLVLLRAPRRVVHVAQVVLAFLVVEVVLDELLLVLELQEDGEDAEESEEDFLVDVLVGRVRSHDIIFMYLWFMDCLPC